MKLTTRILTQHGVITKLEIASEHGGPYNSAVASAENRIEIHAKFSCVLALYCRGKYTAALDIGVPGDTVESVCEDFKSFLRQYLV